MFCSRAEPALVSQRVEITVDKACDLVVSAAVLTAGVSGRPERVYKNLPGKERPIDGAMRWRPAGGVSSCGLAYMTAVENKIADQCAHDGDPEVLRTSHSLKARPGRRYRFWQIAALVPEVMHLQPELQAARLVSMNHELGFEELRARNRAEWDELWKSRVVLVGAERRWQEMADAAFYYLNSSVHSSAPASTSIFGLATWKNYHYYYGHVMWDIETFLVPVLSMVQPHAAVAILEYRYRSIRGASNNARLFGLRGLMFPWESAPSTGDEAAPMPGSASWHEDHVTLDVALAFAFHARITGDGEFIKTRAWPILAGVAEWLESRVVKTARGYEICETMGIAERVDTADNAAFTNFSAKLALRAALEIGEIAGGSVKPVWREIADGLVVPTEDGAVISYDGYRDDDEKGATPDPLAVVFPLCYPLSPECERATLARFLPMAKDYIGSPMLSAFYGVWSAWSGDRAQAAQLLDEGYAAFLHDRFMQTLEYRPDKFPEQPRAGPFFANLGGFLMGLLLGFPAIIPDQGDPQAWARRPVTLPLGWEGIEVERVWIRGKPARLSARQAAKHALLEVG
jgi:trehalose/maltose hydrolase-like predicted phosphorylase